MGGWKYVHERMHIPSPCAQHQSHSGEWWAWPDSRLVWPLPPEEGADILVSAPKSCEWTGTMLYPWEPQVGIEQYKLGFYLDSETGLMAPTGKIEKWPNVWRNKGSQEGMKLGRMPANLYLPFEDRYLFLEEWKLAKSHLTIEWNYVCCFTFLTVSFSFSFKF